jgi:hypothetical protein
MTLEEFCIVSKCNGVFSEPFRPDLNEEDTENEIIQLLKKNAHKNLVENSHYNKLDHGELHYMNKSGVIKHDGSNSECKHNEDVEIKKGNLEFFRDCVYATTRRENFFLVTNTSRKALKQTGEGHFSPVAALNLKEDNLLLLDAARFKYHSMWFKIPLIFNAFSQIDKSTNKPRGFILCSRYY